MKPNRSNRKPPAHLGPEGRKWWRAIVAEFVLTHEAEWELLSQAASCLDRIAECRKEIARDGLTTTTAAGGVKPHPAAGIERDNRVLFARLCRELRLNEAAADTTNRLPRIARRA